MGGIIGRSDDGRLHDRDDFPTFGSIENPGGEFIIRTVGDVARHGVGLPSTTTAAEDADDHQCTGEENETDLRHFDARS